MFTPMRPFTRATALASGLIDDDLRGPSYRQLIWGVHDSASVPETAALLAEAALLVHPP